jgi:6-phosphogluconolactonase
VAVDLLGRFVYVANLSGRNTSAYRIDNDGALTTVAGSPFPTGNGPTSVAVDPLGRFVYETDSGLAFGAVLAYTIGHDGALTPVPGSPFPTGYFSDSIDSLAVDLLGRFVYVASVNGNNISAYQIGENGALTPVPGSPFPAGSFPRSVAVSP